MNATQWESSWKEGVAALDSASVSIERMKHRTAYIIQELDRLDEEDKSLLHRIKGWIKR